MMISKIKKKQLSR